MNGITCYEGDSLEVVAQRLIAATAAALGIDPRDIDRPRITPAPADPPPALQAA